MRRSIAALAVLVAALPLGRAVAAAPEDWLLVRVSTADLAATDLRFVVIANAAGSGKDVALVGIGFAQTGLARTVDVMPVGGGPIRVSTTNGVGGADVTVLEGADPSGARITVDVAAPRIEPRTTIAVLIFVTGMELTSVEVPPPLTGTGSVGLRIERGGGARAMDAVDPSADGIAVAAGPAAASHGTAHDATVASGLVGGFVAFDFCYACVASWRAPGGDGGTTTSLDASVVGIAGGDYGFAGGPGEWRWEWSGVGVARDVLGVPERFPSFGAYAPIGAAWTLFRA